MDTKVINAWLRQAKYRAAKKHVISSVTLEEIQATLQHYNNRCAYCNQAAIGLDHALPLKDGAPNVQANILPCCAACRTLKQGDLIDFYQQGYLSQQQYLDILRYLLSQTGGELVKSAIKKIVSIY